MKRYLEESGVSGYGRTRSFTGNSPGSFGAATQVHYDATAALSHAPLPPMQQHDQQQPPYPQWSQLGAYAAKGSAGVSDDVSGRRNAPEASPVDPLAYPSLAHLRYTGCGWAWTCLAAGSIEEARRASVAENDLLSYAAALTLSGDASRTLLILEAYVVGACVACHEALARRSCAASADSAARRHHKVVAEWLQQRSGPNTPLKDTEYRRVLRHVYALVDARAVRRWYLLALALVRSEDGAVPYEAPSNVWVRYFFGLFPDRVPREAGGRASRGGAIPTCLETLDASETLGLLLSQCTEYEVQYVSAVTAFATQHWRSTLIFATRTLEQIAAAGAVDGGGGSPENVSGYEPQKVVLNRGMDGSGESLRQRQTRWRDTVAMIFIRCRAALEVGERPQAAADIIALLHQQVLHSAGDARSGGVGDCLGSTTGKTTKVVDAAASVTAREAAYVSSVGLALALYGVPLSEAREPLLRVLADDSAAADSSTTARRYLLELAVYVHSLTLLQLGELEAAAAIASRLLVRVPASVLRDGLADVVVRCSVGLEDSTRVLETPLSPHRLLYLALCPSFFGGLSRDGIRLRRHTDAFSLLYPSHLTPYMPVRQMLPFHMNRAFYFFSHGNYTDAWDDICCAVAGADEIVGSADFVFTECFPLRVYFFGCQVALVLLETLFQEEVGAFAACLHAEDAASLPKVLSDQLPPLPSTLATIGATAGSPLSVHSLLENRGQAEITAALIRGKTRVYAENDELAREVIAFCRQWTRQIQLYYPHSILGDVAQVRVAVMTRERDMLKQAVVLSRRYPNSTLAQNTLTLALYFSHNTSEAVDTAQKNFEDFPHARDVMEVYRWLQREKMVYVFNYRTLVPLRYRVGDGTRVFTKRMVIAVVLLTFNFCIVLLTCLLNLPQLIDIREDARGVAVRLQLPSMVPIYFAAVILVHAIVAAATPKNLIHTFLIDNHFCDTALSRLLFSLRGMALVNVVNALQISLEGNNFLFDSPFYTFLLYLALTCLFMPFTTRAWFLPSIDEPHVGILSWLTLLSVDTVIAFFIVVPHILLAALEPFMCLVYYFFLPSVRPTEQTASGSVRRRLLYHEQNRHAMPSRFSVGSGSRFIHVRFLSYLYRDTHSARETANLDVVQLEAEGYRAFPLVPTASVSVEVDELMAGGGGGGRPRNPDGKGSLNAERKGLDSGDDINRRGSGGTDNEASHLAPLRGQKMPTNEPLLAACGEALLAELCRADDDHDGESAGQLQPQQRRQHPQQGQGEDSDAGNTSRAGARPGSLTSSTVYNRSPTSSVDGDAALPEPNVVVPALTRTSSRASFRNSEQFQGTGADTDRLVDLVEKTLLNTAAGRVPYGSAGRTLTRANASFAVRTKSNIPGTRTGPTSSLAVPVPAGRQFSFKGSQRVTSTSAETAATMPIRAGGGRVGQSRHPHRQQQERRHRQPQTPPPRVPMPPPPPLTFEGIPEIVTEGGSFSDSTTTTSTTEEDGDAWWLPQIDDAGSLAEDSDGNGGSDGSDSDDESTNDTTTVAPPIVPFTKMPASRAAAGGAVTAGESSGRTHRRAYRSRGSPAEDQLLTAFAGGGTTSRAQITTAAAAGVGVRNPLYASTDPTADSEPISPAHRLRLVAAVRPAMNTGTRFALPPPQQPMWNDASLDSYGYSSDWWPNNRGEETADQPTAEVYESNALHGPSPVMAPQQHLQQQQPTSPQRRLGGSEGSGRQQRALPQVAQPVRTVSLDSNEFALYGFFDRSHGASAALAGATQARDISPNASTSFDMHAGENAKDSSEASDEISF